MPKKGGKKGKKGSKVAKAPSEATPEELAALEKKKVIQELKLLKSEHTTELKLTNGFQQAKVRAILTFQLIYLYQYISHACFHHRRNWRTFG
jgi:hypothetical protein